MVIATEWKEFKTIDWQAVYDGMSKPAFVFDGRLLLDVDSLKKIGFKVGEISLPLSIVFLLRSHRSPALAAAKRLLHRTRPDVSILHSFRSDFLVAHLLDASSWSCYYCR